MPYSQLEADVGMVLSMPALPAFHAPDADHVVCLAVQEEEEVTQDWIPTFSSRLHIGLPE